jgi:hypothetical protein
MGRLNMGGGYFIFNSFVVGLFYYIPGMHKIMVKFQKLIKNVFIILHMHNIHCQQRELSTFLMGYQQLASHGYCGTSFQDGVRARLGFLCTPF